MGHRTSSSHDRRKLGTTAPTNRHSEDPKILSDSAQTIPGAQEPSLSWTESPTAQSARTVDTLASSALHTIENNYDLVIVDAAPQLNLVTINVLNTVGELIVPVDAGLYSVVGLGRLEETIDQVRRFLDNRDSGSRAWCSRRPPQPGDQGPRSQLREVYGDRVYQTTIPHSVRVEEAHARHRTVLEFAPKSPPALAYDRLLTEVLKHGQSQRNARRADPSDGDADAA